MDDLEGKFEMRTFAIVFATFFTVALFCFVVPMLYHAKSADKQGSSPAAEERAPLARRMGFENSIRSSQPFWLLVLGTALILSANQLSRLLQARASVPLPAPASGNTRARGTTPDGSVRAVSLDSTPLDEHSGWRVSQKARSIEGCEVDRL
jgi:hypothetical protein